MSQQPAALLDRILDVIERDIVPMTQKGVSLGNKVFGAAIPRKSDLSLVLAEKQRRDRESAVARRGACHQEILRNVVGGAAAAAGLHFYRDARSRVRSASRQSPGLASTISISCSATRTARDAFNIPHDLKILKEVFRLDPGEYNASNSFWTGHAIRKLAAALDATERTRIEARMRTIAAAYDALSER